MKDIIKHIFDFAFLGVFISPKRKTNNISLLRNLFKNSVRQPVLFFATYER